MTYARLEEEDRRSKIDHPSHYGGGENPYEAIKVIEAYDLNFNLGSALKYMLRAGKKDGEPTEDDLAKAIWYLTRERDRVCRLRIQEKASPPR